jgi:hypothetical protein
MALISPAQANDDDHRGERHRRYGDDRGERITEGAALHAGRYRHASRTVIVDEGKEQVLFPADSRRACTLPLRSPVIRVIPALAIATSMPVPIAIPTPVAARAGGSRRASPRARVSTAEAGQSITQRPRKLHCCSNSRAKVAGIGGCAAARFRAVCDRRVFLLTPTAGDEPIGHGPDGTPAEH